MFGVKKFPAAAEQICAAPSVDSQNIHIAHNTMVRIASLIIGVQLDKTSKNTKDLKVQSGVNHCKDHKINVDYLFSWLKGK
jgi:hypothetical protein